MYAIIRDRGRQYRVTQGTTIIIDRREAAPGTEVIFDEVLLVGTEGGGGTTKVGTPTVAGASVKGSILGDVRGKKIRIYKYKRHKTSSRKRQGHRQTWTRLRIDAITA